MSERFVGIDVSKASLEVCVRPDGTGFSVPNSDEGVEDLVRIMREIRPVLVVMEPSGGYEREILRALHREQLPVALPSAFRSKSFMRANGGLAKTDKADAAGLARFAETMKPEPQAPRTDEDEEARARVTRRRQLAEMIVAEKNRLRTAPKVVREPIKKHIQWLEDERDALDRELEAEIAHRPDWKESHALLQSAKGVGKVVSLILLTQLPELGHMDRRKIATLVGVAPLNRDSGQRHGKRAIWGGRPEVRRALFLAAMTAIRYPGPVQELHDRLVSAGKERMVALIACARKLLTILNAMMRDGRAWDPTASRRRACGNVGAALEPQMA